MAHPNPSGRPATRSFVSPLFASRHAAPAAGAPGADAARPAVDETADKLDSMMELTFQHLERRGAAGQLGAAWDTLLGAFERSVLLTHRSKFTQVRRLWACILASLLCWALCSVDDGLLQLWLVRMPTCGPQAMLLQVSWQVPARFNNFFSPTHPPSPPQFLLFYACRQQPEQRCRAFLHLLLARLTDRQQPPIARAACAAYAASFLAR